MSGRLQNSFDLEVVLLMSEYQALTCNPALLTIL